MGKRSKTYTIGEVSKICDLSKKALRYYEEIGLITSIRNTGNNYRYYTHDAILMVPVIKYYKQAGFRLDEMKAFLEGNTQDAYRIMQRAFLCKTRELEKEEELIRRKHRSVKDWYDLIVEAELVIENDTHNVGVKFFQPCELLCLEQNFTNDIKDAIINIEFTNYVKSVGNEITGPVIINFESHEDRTAGNPQKIKMLQKALLPCRQNQTIRFGGRMMVSCYHIGSHESIGRTYEKIRKWSKMHRYRISRQSYERYVTDYWTTENTDQFVTEILMAVTRA